MPVELRLVPAAGREAWVSLAIQGQVVVPAVAAVQEAVVGAAEAGETIAAMMEALEIMVAPEDRVRQAMEAFLETQVAWV